MQLKSIRSNTNIRDFNISDKFYTPVGLVLETNCKLKWSILISILFHFSQRSSSYAVHISKGHLAGREFER